MIYIWNIILNLSKVPVFKGMNNLKIFDLNGSIRKTEEKINLISYINFIVDHQIWYKLFEHFISSEETHLFSNRLNGEHRIQKILFLANFHVFVDYVNWFCVWTVVVEWKMVHYLCSNIFWYVHSIKC